MSDYLGNLAARSLASVPALRPRLASRFEPRSPAAPPLAVNPAAAEPELAEESVEVKAEPLQARRSRRRVVERMAEAGVAARIEAPPAVMPQARVARRGGPSFEASPPVSTAADFVDFARAAGALSGASARGRVGEGVLVDAGATPSPTLPRFAGEGATAPGRPKVAPVGTAGEASHANRPAHEEPRGAVRPAAAGPGPSVLTPSRDPVLRPAPPVSFPQAVRETPPSSAGASPAARDLPAKRLPAEERLVAPPLQPRLPELPSLPIRAETPAAEPVIQITIGRIEVRATPPPAQPSRPRAAAPAAPSLEEYLRRRSQRGEG